MAQEFTGFSKTTFQYLQDLQNNNSRDWFEANRDRYERCWKAPALALITSLLGPMAALSPPLKAEARINGTLRRINRDVRFSKDKSPYNARMHLIFWAGSHPNRSPAFHLVLNPDGLGYGAGVFGLDTPSLKQYRDRITNTSDRAALLRAITASESTGCQFDDPDLKRLPAGYETSSDWEHLLRRKAFVMRTLDQLPAPDWLFASDCTEQIMKIVADQMPLIKWLTP